MGCGASARRDDGPVALAKSQELQRLAPICARMEVLADFHRKGHLSAWEFELERQALLAEMRGQTVAPLLPDPIDLRLRQQEERLRKQEELRRRLAAFEEQMRTSPGLLPDDYFNLLDSMPLKFTREVGEQDEWRNASSGPMQNFYNSVAGRDIDALLSDGTIPLDAHRNPIGTKFDLSRDGAMEAHTVLILWFCKEGTYGKPVEALRQKGFKVVVHTAGTSTTQQMMVALLTADVLWLVSGSTYLETFGPLLESIVRFHRKGGGIFVWADNAPYFVHANRLLERLFPGEGIVMEGNDYGGKVMHLGGNGRTPGQLMRGHLIFTGLQSLFEGITVSYLSKVGPLKVLATYNDGQGYSGKACCAVADAEVYSRLQVPASQCRGRIVIDGGFTKLYDEYWFATAGTERYVKNATAWLLNMNSRLISEAVQGEAPDLRSRDVGADANGGFGHHSQQPMQEMQQTLRGTGFRPEAMPGASALPASLQRGIPQASSPGSPGMQTRRQQWRPGGAYAAGPGM